MIKKILTIAGSDSSGGAGIQADLKTFSALGAYGESVICAVTAQNTMGVTDVFDVSAENVRAQLDAVFSDLEPDAVKIGMVSSTDIIKEVAAALKKYKPRFTVLDPVMVSTSGHALCKEDAVRAIITELVPIADIVTPNIPEAEVISGMDIKDAADIEKAAKIIAEKGAGAVLIKGGHLSGAAEDTLYTNGKIYKFTEQRVQTRNTHGTGCTLSSALAVYAAQGLALDEAVAAAKKYLTGALEKAYDIGGGHGPVHHFWRYW